MPYLQLCDKVDITVVSKSFPDPLFQNLGESFVDFEPGRIKAQAQRGSVGIVVPEK